MEGPLRSTYADPRVYGARLFVGEDKVYDDDDFGSMNYIDHRKLSEAWEQVCYLVNAASGEKAFQRLTPDEQSTDIRVSNCRCVYVLEGDDRWSEQHPYFGPEMSIQYRRPGPHPDADVWESADAETFVTDEDGSLWFVAELDDWYGGTQAYLMLHSNIATKSLRKAAVSSFAPALGDVEVSLDCF